MRKKFFILVFLSLLLYGFDYFHLINVIKEPLEPYIVSVKKNIFQNFSQIKLLPKILFSYNTLQERIRESHKIRNDNSQMQLKITSLEEENASLRRQLGAPLPSNYQFITSDIIAVSRHMEIDSGRRQGIKPGMSIVDGLTLIGRVSQVTENRSLITLLTDRELSVPAISNRGTRGKVEGQLGELVVLKEVLQKDQLFLDDIILTSGEGGFPPKLIIGKITRIKSDDAAVYKEASVELFADITLLKKIFVIAQ